MAGSNRSVPLLSKGLGEVFIKMVATKTSGIPESIFLNLLIRVSLMLIARRNDINCIVSNLRILSAGYPLVFFLLMLNNSIAFAYKYNLKTPISINSVEKIKKDNMVFYEKDESLVKTIASRRGDQLNYNNIPTSHDLLEKGLEIQLKEVSESEFVKKVLLGENQVNGDYINQLIAENEKKSLAIYFPPGVFVVSEPIVLKDDTALIGSDFGETVLEANSNINGPLISAEKVEKFLIKRMTIVNDKHTSVFIHHAKHFRVKQLKILYSGGYALHIDSNTESGVIEESTIVASNFGGILLKGKVENVFIANNLIEGAYQGQLEISNFAAAILIAGFHDARKEFWSGGIIEAEKPVKADHLFNGVFYHYLGPKKPANIVLLNNRIINNRSQGVYLNGAIRTLLKNNIISNADKEGICVDHQSYFNVLDGNFISGSGSRRRQSKIDVNNDFIDAKKRMPDGSPKSKLPGISIDYSDFNLLKNNLVSGNFGGGIKTVRSASGNVIINNRLLDNNRGTNDVHRFPEILLGDSRTEGTQKSSRRIIFDNREFGSHGNLVINNYVQSKDRGILIKGRSKFSVLGGNNIIIKKGYAISDRSKHTKIVHE